MDNYLVRLINTDIGYLRCLNDQAKGYTTLPHQKKLEQHIGLLEQVVRGIQSIPKLPLKSVNLPRE